jgi:hypothetical protein
MCDRHIAVMIYYPRRYASADRQKYREDDAHCPPDG